MKRIFRYAASAAIVIACIACGEDDRNKVIPGGGEDDPGNGGTAGYVDVVPAPKAFDGNKQADITYQLLVYSFADSDGDGWGDIRGVTSHLDYLDAMGASALWLSPIHPSDSYHGYDVQDYSAVHPKLGTDSDLQELISKAHEKDIKIYLDYVLNHSGTGNAWFKSAASSASSEYRDFYVFSSSPQTDISAGLIPSLSSYDADKWYKTSGGSGTGYTGRLHFKLDWNARTITVTSTTDAAQASNPDTSIDYFIYYGNDQIRRMYKTASSVYEITLDFDSEWGFLVRTSSTSWDNNTKWGSGTGAAISLGTPYTLTSTNPQNIPFGAASYYYGAFWSGMPDLNYGDLASLETNATFNALASSAKKWIDMGIDGLRLDAVLYIYEKDAPTSNATFLKKWYDRCNTYYKAAGGKGEFYMVGEAWTGTDVMARYYKGLPALFDFEYWDRLSWALNSSIGRYFTKDVLNIRNICRAQRSDFIEATKLTNHDQTRAATQLGRSLAKEKLAACVLLTSPGNPYIYQGEELGYWGKIEAEGGADEQVRTPVMWTKTGTVPSSWTSASNIDKNMLSAGISVEAQESDAGSLLNVYKSFAQLRNSYASLSSGEMSAHSKYNDSNASDESVACWYMTSGSEKMLVVHNFASSAKVLDFSGDKLTQPVALNGTARVDGGNLELGAHSSVVFLQ